MRIYNSIVLNIILLEATFSVLNKNKVESTAINLLGRICEVKQTYRITDEELWVEKKNLIT